MIQLNSQRRWGARCARCNSALPITLFGWVSDTLQQEASAGFGEPNLGGIRHRSWIWNHAISVPVLYWKNNRERKPVPLPICSKVVCVKAVFSPSVAMAVLLVGKVWYQSMAARQSRQTYWNGQGKHGLQRRMELDLWARLAKSGWPEYTGIRQKSRNVSSYRMASQTISIGECIDA